MVGLYNEGIHDMINYHVPWQGRNVIVGHNWQCFTTELHMIKRTKQKTERTWLQTSSTVHNKINKEPI